MSYNASCILGRIFKVWQ